jgi:hypothetical protein
MSGTLHQFGNREFHRPTMKDNQDEAQQCVVGSIHSLWQVHWNTLSAVRESETKHRYAQATY